MAVLAGLRGIAADPSGLRRSGRRGHGAEICGLVWTAGNTVSQRPADSDASGLVGTLMIRRSEIRRFF